MTAIMNKRKVLSVKGNVEAIGQIKNGTRKADLFQEFCVVNSAILMMCKTRTKFISAFEQKGLRTKGYRKPERSNIDEVLLKSLQRNRSDSVE
jgi:hypothetical protein